MKKILSIIFIGLLLVTLSACGVDKKQTSSSNNDELTSYNLRFSTGTTTGIYYPLGAILADFWSKEFDYINGSAQASNGSVQNLNFLEQGETEVGFTTAGAAIEAYEGVDAFDGRAYKDVRILASLYPNYNYFVARKGAGVESIFDIEGKSYAPGATGSATEKESQRTLEAYGLSFDDVTTNFVGFTEATDLMRNNQISGAMINAGIPTAAVSEMLSTANGVLLNYDRTELDALISEYPYYVEAIIPAGTYDNQPNDVVTLAQYNFIVVDASMPDQVAYDLAKSMWEKLDSLKGSHGVIDQFDLQKATDGIANIPLHPGVAKFYKEKGIIN